MSPDTWTGHRDINESIIEIFKTKIAEEEDKNQKKVVLE